MVNYELIIPNKFLDMIQPCVLTNPAVAGIPIGTVPQCLFPAVFGHMMSTEISAKVDDDNPLFLKID